MKSGIAPVAALFACLAASATAAQEIPVVGELTYVKDGDTICVASIEIRLEGIDAPETRDRCRRGSRRWRCGASATKALRAMAAGRALTCQPKYCDPYGRTVALCRLGGVDLAEAMVAAGWAVDWPYYSRGRYRKAQQAAREAGRGFWAEGGGPTKRMRARMRRPGSRRGHGPWPPCRARCDPALNEIR